jgi:hypothetical protein
VRRRESSLKSSYQPSTIGRQPSAVSFPAVAPLPIARDTGDFRIADNLDYLDYLDYRDYHDYHIGCLSCLS